MTSMTPTDTDNLGILDPDYMRRMGESEESIEYLTSRRPESVSLLEVFGEALDPRALTMELAVAAMTPPKYTAPATETGD